MKPTDPPSSQRWALYRSDLGDYMHRWIFRTPWGTLRIHHILKSDEGRDLHDHPFDFISIILRGGYLEHRPRHEDCQTYNALSIVKRKATDLHSLELLEGKTAWTFVVTSRYRRKWGFQTCKGWVPYDEYYRSYQ